MKVMSSEKDTMLEAFISLCIIPFPCKYAIPRATSSTIFRFWGHDRPPVSKIFRNQKVIFFVSLYFDTFVILPFSIKSESM